MLISESLKYSSLSILYFIALIGATSNFRLSSEKRIIVVSSLAQCRINNLFDTINAYYNGECIDKDISSTSTIEDINKRLFKNINNKKNVGKIRTGQNFIGGNSELSALFVPPPEKHLKELLQDLENFWKNSTLYLPTLIKIAIYHYQFETIHPFNDGNGRTGRLLINLQMREKEILKHPVLCLSEYWGKNKGLYYTALTNVRFSNDIEHWIRFFLESIIETTKEQIDIISSIDSLYSNYSKSIISNIKAPTKHKELLEKLFKKPSITVSIATEILCIPYQNANKIIQDLVKLGIIKARNNNKRNRVFELSGYMDIIFKSIL